MTLTNIGSSSGGYNNGNGWVPNTTLGINGVLTLGDNVTNAQADFSNVPSFVCGGFKLNANSRFVAPKAVMTVNGNWTDNQVVSGTNKGFLLMVRPLLFLVEPVLVLHPIQLVHLQEMLKHLII